MKEESIYTLTCRGGQEIAEVGTVVDTVVNNTLGGGGRIPSITSSLVTIACLNKGRLF